MTLALLITAVGGAWAQKRGGTNADASVAKARIMAKTPRRALAKPENATILYQQNFDGTNDINELGWTFVDNDGDGRNWTMSINGKYDYDKHEFPSEASTSVPNSLYSQSFTDDGEFAINADNWAITPAIEIYESSILSFQLAYGNPDYPDKVGVYVGETPNVNEMTEVLPLTSFSRTAKRQFNEETVDLSAFAGKTCYIAFRHQDNDKYVVFIDDVVVYTTDPRFYSFKMPANDVTVNYTLVRDLTDEVNKVVFGGLPEGDAAIVKKGDDGKFAFKNGTPAITLNDPLADNADIIGSEDLNVEVSKYGASMTFEKTIALADFLANPEPGTYEIIVRGTADGSYDGWVGTPYFTLTEQYDLAIAPADGMSKRGVVETVTVGTRTVTLDADGKASTTAQPAEKVTIKAKRGYVIEKVEVEKKAAATTITIGVDPNGHSNAPAKTIEYTAGETWAEVAARYDWLSTYDVYTVYHTDYTPGNLMYVDSINGPTGVKPNDTVDPEKTYIWGD